MNLILVILILNILNVNGEKLLVFSMSGSKSHMMSNGRIADALAEAGHDVTFLSVEAFISTSDFPTTKLAKVVTIGRIPDDRKAIWQKVKGSATEGAFQEKGLFDTYKQFPQFVGALSSFVELALKENQETLEKLKSEKFDAIFYEQLFPHGAAFGHLFGIDIHFLINSCPIQEHITKLFGIPNPTGWVPSVGGLSISDKMTFYERAQNELEHIILTFGYSMLFTSATDTFQKYYGLSFPDAKDIIKERVPLSFVAVDEFIEFPRPIFHNLVYIGGLGLKDAKNLTLNEPFESEMKKGKKGIVFFSLGSNTDSTNLPKIVKKNLLDGFAQFPDYHFIVKLEPTDDFGISYAKTISNIFVTNWAPQAMLLQHPRMKLFVTHGGYNSLLEVAHSGVPVLLMPMMYDQTRNGQIVQRNGWGKVLEKMELLNGKETLVTLLGEMLTHEKYHKAAQRIKHLLKTKPFSANEIFIKNVEFVLKNGGKLPELRPASMDINFIAQNNLDVYAILILSLLLLISFVLLTVIYSFRVLRAFISRKSNSSKKIN
uniref:Glucuronosyltransferase n=1 Tax=Panagrolaimus sp. PS1159 TaxID=55785 RepID=A0AC35ET46_9BILA